MKRIFIGVAFGLLIYSALLGAVISFALTVTAENWPPYYRPAVAMVTAGAPIRIVNPTASPHTIRHDGCLENKGVCGFDSGLVAPNGNYTIPGLAPGRYSYHCELHPIMRGTLIVGEPAVPTSEPEFNDRPADFGAHASFVTGQGSPPRGDVKTDPARERR